MTISTALENALALLEANGYLSGGDIQDIHDDLEISNQCVVQRIPKCCTTGASVCHTVVEGKPSTRDSWCCNPIYAEATFPNGPQLSDLPNILSCPYLK